MPGKKPTKVDKILDPDKNVLVGGCDSLNLINSYFTNLGPNLVKNLPVIDCPYDKACNVKSIENIPLISLFFFFFLICFYLVKGLGITVLPPPPTQTDMYIFTLAGIFDLHT